MTRRQVALAPAGQQRMAGNTLTLLNNPYLGSRPLHSTWRLREQRLMHHLFYPQVGNFTLALLGSFNLVLTRVSAGVPLCLYLPQKPRTG